MPEFRCVDVPLVPRPLERLHAAIGDEGWRRLRATQGFARREFGDRAVWSISSTTRGGGVAEMLRSLLAYARGAGIDARWSVVTGPPEFFTLTKRLHNRLHGDPGDGGPIGRDEHRLYEQVLAANADDLAGRLRPGDVVILHDPQTAGMAGRLRHAGATVVWRCHVGTDRAGDEVREPWAFLVPYVEEADAVVFSRRGFVPEMLSREPVAIIAPSIDPASAKNQELEPTVIRAILDRTGLVRDHAPGGVAPAFRRDDGSPGRVDRFCEVVRTGPSPSTDEPLVVHVSRWDRLKDPVGTLRGFAEHAVDSTGAHLILAGPTVRSVADDPEAVAAFDEAVAAWRDLPHERRRHVQLACLPMADVEENGAIVDALQRQATVVTQKSRREGFGLTITEAMWKARPVVASGVGGILDQVEDGRSGVLLDDPEDLAHFGAEVAGLLADAPRGEALGAGARARVREHFLHDRHLEQYAALLAALSNGGEVPASPEAPAGAGAQP
jgi:trehalose synthase